MIIAETETHTYLSMAKEAASLAGSFLGKRDQSLTHVNSAEGKDIKLAADVSAEKIIIDYLAVKTPFSILSEERGFTPREEGDYTWIVDPLDGTMNYFKNIPLCCVSIGLWHKGEPLLGVVDDFNTHEVYSGIVGEGAWINNEKIIVSDIDQKQNAVLSTGFPSNTDLSQEALGELFTDIREFKKIRMIGSAALSICYVACGRVDAYYEKDIMLWDIAGGIPIVLGAGGVAGQKEAKQEYSYNVFISNGKLK